MSLVALGANHRTMTLEGLERISVPESKTDAALESITSSAGVRGAVVLSTCNRVELYVDARTDREGIAACKEFFEHRIGEGGVTPAAGFYAEHGDDVVRHLFYVICSLDSQVLGEAQILGQVKDAYLVSEGQGMCTSVLTKLFKDAISVGKRARSETAIGNDSVSISTTAFKAALDEFDDVKDCQVLFVGTGEMARLTLTYLLESGVTDFLVTGRTETHIRDFAKGCNALVYAFEERYDALAKADIVFTMTSTDHPVIEAGPLEEARRRAGTCGRKLVIIDEAVPRDVEEKCAELPGVVLYNLESLSQIIDEGMAKRMAAVGAVERFIAEAEEAFLGWMQQQNVEPTIREMRAKGDALVAAELERAMKSFRSLRGENVSDEERAVLEAFGKSVMNKILHGPTVRLKREAEIADSYYYTDATRYLFGLDTYPPGCTPHFCRERPCLSGGDCPKGLK